MLVVLVLVVLGVVVATRRVHGCARRVRRNLPEHRNVAAGYIGDGRTLEAITDDIHGVGEPWGQGYEEGANVPVKRGGQLRCKRGCRYRSGRDKRRS